VVHTYIWIHTIYWRIWNLIWIMSWLYSTIRKRLKDKYYNKKLSNKVYRHDKRRSSPWRVSLLWTKLTGRYCIYYVCM
jgi:hypothetical protein